MKNKINNNFNFYILPLKVNALIEVDITRGNLNPLPIAVSALYSDKQTNECFKKKLKLIKLEMKYL